MTAGSKRVSGTSYLVSPRHLVGVGALRRSSCRRLRSSRKRWGSPVTTVWRAASLALICAALVACGGVAAKDVPPTGQIWFGQSFDPSTFALTGQRQTVGTQEPVAMVAHLTKPANGSVTIRASLDGALVNSAPVTVQGNGDVFGYVLGSLVTPGSWKYDVVDVGGNVLASGTVTAQ